jgi:CheY-like chemotaxis protein
MSRPYRILLFDDDEEYLSLVERGAVGNPDQPIDWITASTEDEVKSQLKINQGEIDLILIDYLLPRRSGVEFLQSLRREGHAVPSLLISHLDEKSFLSDLAGRHKNVEVFSLHIIGFLQKPSNMIDNYPRFVEEIIEYDRKNRTILFNTSMQFMNNADSFLRNLRLDVATISRALSMLAIHFRRSVVIRRHSQLASLISAIEEIEANLWEVASKLSDAWRTLRDIAISGVKMAPRDTSSFRPPDIAVKLAREDKRRIRTLLMGKASLKNTELLPRVNRALERERNPTHRTEILRDLVIGISQIDDDFQTSSNNNVAKAKQHEHGTLLLSVENLLSEKGEGKLALIVKIIRLKHLKRCGQEKEFAFSLDSAFKSSMDLPNNVLKREVLSTLQGLVDYESR